MPTWFLNYGCFSSRPSRNSFETRVPGLWAVLSHLFTRVPGPWQGFHFIQVAKSLLRHPLASRTLSSSMATAGPPRPGCRGMEECRRHDHLARPRPSQRQRDVRVHPSRNWVTYHVWPQRAARSGRGEHPHSGLSENTPGGHVSPQTVVIWNPQQTENLLRAEIVFCTSWNHQNQTWGPKWDRS